MAGDSLGKLFKITVWGESHGPSVGVVIEGCPPKIKLNLDDIQKELNRRKPGRNNFVTGRKEDDIFEILSGVFKGKTTGTPISISIKNHSINSSEYHEFQHVYRPGHADFTYQQKYGIRDNLGGGRSSARLTAPIVAAGAIAKQVLLEHFSINLLAYVKQIGKVKSVINSEEVSRNHVNESEIFCPGSSFEEEVKALLTALQKEGNSIGGIVECIIKNVPTGLGEPIFDKLDADLAKVMVGLNAVKGFEIGSGFKTVELTGSENNDEFIFRNGQIVTETNNAGGILGGVSTGMPIVFRVAFKPTPSIAIKQKTIDSENSQTEIVVKGNHDVCVAIRAVPVVEALAAIVICDHFLRHRGQCGVK